MAGAGLPTEAEQVAELDRVMENITGLRAMALSYVLGHLGRYVCTLLAACPCRLLLAPCPYVGLLPSH